MRVPEAAGGWGRQATHCVEHTHWPGKGPVLLGRVCVCSTWFVLPGPQPWVADRDLKLFTHPRASLARPYITTWLLSVPCYGVSVPCYGVSVPCYGVSTHCGSPLP
jgi:hypothetical protein